MKICSTCNKQSRENAVLCIYCGASFSSNPATSGSRSDAHPGDVDVAKSETLVNLSDESPAVAKQILSVSHAPADQEVSRHALQTMPGGSIETIQAIPNYDSLKTVSSFERSTSHDDDKNSNSASMETNIDQATSTARAARPEIYIGKNSRSAPHTKIIALIGACIAAVLVSLTAFFQLRAPNSVPPAGNTSEEVPVTQEVNSGQSSISSTKAPRESVEATSANAQSSEQAIDVNVAEQESAPERENLPQSDKKTGDGLAVVMSLPAAADYYPKSFVSSGNSGSANVKVCINQAGAIQELPTVIKTSGNLELDLAAIEVVKAGKFAPAEVTYSQSARYCAVAYVEFRAPAVLPGNKADGEPEEPISIRVLADPTFTGCSYPAERPSIPDGRTAVMEQMVRAQRLVREYDRLTTQFQECVKSQFPGAAGVRRSAEVAERRVNDTYDDVSQLAEELNKEIKVFRSRSRAK